MKVLITGAGGMVGKNLLEHPGISDFDVLSPGRNELDLCDRKDTERYLNQHRPDIVVHAAGLVGGIQANVQRPVDFLAENLDINRNLIGCCFQLGIRRLLNLGSSCMYPRNHAEPLTESMILTGELEPTNEGYALAKIVAERYCEYIVRENPDFFYKTLIPCNLYGRYDRFNLERAHLLPSIIVKIHQAIEQGLDTVEIWGDGKARREFMYAGDLADCVIRCLRNFESVPSVMNVGVGIDHTVNEYYQAAAEVLGYKGHFVHDLDRPVGMRRKLVSIDVQTKWGWKPQHSLFAGIRQTYDYYLQNLRSV